MRIAFGSIIRDKVSADEDAKKDIDEPFKTILKLKTLLERYGFESMFAVRRIRALRPY